ncbi:MAG TPA: hypothetical protein VFN78_08460 [Ktedonobacterales bacterium]|nr:hypothetical protein [Ktedonobacterales bacterium]
MARGVDDSTGFVLAASFVLVGFATATFMAAVCSVMGFIAVDFGALD